MQATKKILYTIADLHNQGGRDRFKTKDDKYEIENWGKGYEKGFGFIKTSPDRYVVFNYGELKIESNVLCHSENLQDCIDFINNL